MTTLSGLFAAAYLIVTLGLDPRVYA